MAALASCSDDLPNGVQQQYPEPDGVFETSGLVLSQAQSTLNLVADNEANRNVALAVIDEKVNFPANYDLVVEGEVSGSADFSKSARFACLVEDSAINANPDILNGAIQKAISKAPGKYDLHIRYYAYAVRDEKEDTKVQLGGINHSFADYAYNVTTLNPEKVIEENYYLVGSFCGWDIKKAIKMTNTVAGQNQYDNPIFAVKFDVAEGGIQWMVIPESTYQSGDYATGAYGAVPNAQGTGGVLRATNAQGVNAGVISNVGPMLVSIDMFNDTYTVSYAFDVLYTFTDPKKPWTLQTSDYFNYCGVAQITTSAYISQEPKISGVILFKQDKSVEPEVLPDSIVSGNLVGSLNGTDGKNVMMPAKGKKFYWVEVNFVNMTYKFSTIRSIRVVGSGNGWNQKEGPLLTPSKDYKIWTAKGVEIGDMFKLNCNEDWTIDFGGSAPDPSVSGNGTVYNLQYKGGNMNATPGTYDVEVNFGVYPYTVTLKK